jgi:predicted RND superfamily exporter protein
MGSEFRAPMGIVVIGGVISSTLLTLLVVPVIFQWMEGVREFSSRLWLRVNGAEAPAIRVTASSTEDAGTPDEEGVAK